MGRIRWIDLRQLLQTAHTLRELGSQQMPLAGMHAQNLAVGGDLESFPSAAMRLQLTFLLLFRHRLSFASGLTHARRCRRPHRRSTLLGRKKSHQYVGLHARSDFDQRVIGYVLQQALHLGAAYFLVSHFTAAMKNHGFYFVAVTQKPNDLVFPNLIIVLGGGRPELYFLELRAFLVFALLVRLLICLIKKFSVIGDLADWRVRIG